MPARRIFAPVSLIFASLALFGCGKPKSFDSVTVRTTPAAVTFAPRASAPNPERAADLALGQYRFFLAATVPAVGAAVHEQTGSPPISQAAAPTLNGVPCDGDLPPCWRVQIESRGTWDAYNPSGCGGAGCFGPYQFSGAWAGKLGLPQDLSTTTHDQWVNAARLLWDGGHGCGNWSACP